jgi:hypothetical protein
MNEPADQPDDLPMDASLLVTVLSAAPEADSEEAWLRAAVGGGAFAFLADPRRTFTKRPTVNHSAMRYKAEV